MNRNYFDNRKVTLKQLLICWNGENALGIKDNQSIAVLKELLEKYNYNNRLIIKGLLTRKIIDSLELGYAIGEKVIEFAKSIS